MTSFNSADRKINRILRNSQEYKVLLDEESSQDQRKLALENLDARRRQRPDSAYRDANNGLTNRVDPSRPSLESEMNKRVTNKHGYEVYAPGYQEFSSSEVFTDPRAWNHNGNISSFPGFRSEMGDQARATAQGAYPHMVIRNNLKQEQVSYVNNVVHALQKQVNEGRLKKEIVFERFERTNEVGQEQLYLIAHGMKIISESYDSTAGSWVVVNPYTDPKTVEEILYNQTGLANTTYKQTRNQQVGNYWAASNAAYESVYNKKQTPAREAPGGEAEYHSGRDVKSQQSLRNPKRGDDFIRNSRIKAARDEEPKMKRVQEEVNYLLEAIEATPYVWEKRKLQKRLVGIKNQLVSDRAEKAKAAQDQMDYGQQLNAVDRSANALNGLYNNTREDEIRQEQQNYARHISLIESANQVLKTNGSKFNQL